MGGGIRRNILYLSVIGLISGSYWSLIYPIYQPFILSLGASMSLLGLLESLRGRMGVLSTLSQLLGGLLADRYGRKVVMATSSASVIVGLLLHLSAARYHDVNILIMGALILALSWLGTPAWNALTMESAKEGGRGLALSITMFMYIVPGIVLSPIGGWIAENYGYLLIFLVSVLMESLCLVIISFFIEESMSERAATLSYETLTTNLVPRVKLLKRLYLVAAMDAFSWGVGSALIYGFLTEWFSFSKVELGILSSIFTASWASAQIPAGKMVDRYGARKTLIVSESVGVAGLVLWLTAKDFPIFAFSQVFLGISPALWIPALNSYIIEKTPKERVASTIGGLSAFRGLLSFPAPYIGGLLFDIAGFYLPIIASSVGVMLTLLAMVALLEE